MRLQKRVFSCNSLDPSPGQNGMGSRLVTQGVCGVSHWFIVVTGLMWDLACTLRKWGVVYYVTHALLKIL